jgi:Zn-dependent M28 family amino/carboxypeptidase
MRGPTAGGSSPAVLLELARVLKQHPDHLSGRFAYRFLFLDGEEAIREQWVDPDNCYGSRHHAERLARTQTLARVAGVILLDLVGDRDLRLERETFSDQSLLELVFAAAREGGLGRHVPTPAERGQPIKDDHLSFTAKGLRAIDLIDFDYGPNNSYWHTVDDNLANCSRESLDAIGRIVLLSLPRIEAHLAP